MWHVQRGWERVVCFLLVQIEQANLAIPLLHRPDYWSLTDEEDEECLEFANLENRAVRFRREDIATRGRVYLEVNAAEARQVLWEFLWKYETDDLVLHDQYQCRVSWYACTTFPGQARPGEMLTLVWTDKTRHLQVICENTQLRKKFKDMVILLFAGYKEKIASEGNKEIAIKDIEDPFLFQSILDRIPVTPNNPLWSNAKLEIEAGNRVDIKSEQVVAPEDAQGSASSGAMPKSRPRTIPKLVKPEAKDEFKTKREPDDEKSAVTGEHYTSKVANIKGRIFRAEEMFSFFESSDPNEMYLTLKEEIEEEIRKRSKLWMKTEWVMPP